MADLYAGLDTGSPALDGTDDAAVAVLFRARYPEMVRLADLLGADDPEDIAQEAFARLIRKHGSLRDPGAALAYVRASVCNLTRNRHRHLRVVRLRTPAGHDVDSSEQIAMLKEDHWEVLAALAELPPRRREAIVLRYWLDLSEREIAAAMGVSPGTVKSHVSRAWPHWHRRWGTRHEHHRRPAAGRAARTRRALTHRPGRLDAHRGQEPEAARPGPGMVQVHDPGCAAAAVVAIVVGATALTGHGGPRGGSGATGSRTASPAPAWVPAPPGPGNYLIKSNPPSSAIVPIRLVTGKQITWTFVWFGRMKSDPGEGIQLCSVTDGGGYYGTGGCAPPGLQAQQGFVEGSGTIRLVVSDKDVTSVTALVAHGRSVSGVSAWGSGFPDKVWLVNYPGEDNATIVMRNAVGQVVKRLAITGQYPIPSQPHSGGIKLFSYPAGSVSATAGTMTAYLLNGSVSGVSGRVVGFWSSGGGSAIGGVPASGPPAVEDIGGSWLRGAKVVEFYGYAHANVARVVLRLPDGRQYSGQTTAAWAGSGLRLWHFAVPIKAATFEPRQQVMLGYDTAGHVVWQQTLG